MMENNTDKQKEETSFEWEAPKDYFLWYSSLLLKEGKRKCIRVLIFSSVLLAAFYVLLKPLPLEDVDVRINLLFLYAGMYALAFPIALFVWVPYRLRRKRSYRVDSEGVWIRYASGVNLYKWKDISYCEPIKSDEQTEGVIIISIRTKIKPKQIAIHFSREQQEFARDVYACILSFVPCQSDPESIQPRLCLTDIQSVYLLAVSIVGAYLMAHYYFLFSGYFKEKPLHALVLIVAFLLFGAGTWGLTSLFGVKEFKHKTWRDAAIIYNLTALVFAVTIIAFKVIYDLRDIFEVS